MRADGRPVAGLPEGQAAPLLAIVDTGLDSSHPWIARTLVDSVDLTGQGEEDRHGHGTWVALTALSSFPMPVGLLNVKALGDDGTGTVDWLARGIRRAAGRGATLINVSAGISQPSCRADCPLCRAALAAADGGALVTAAAGNVPGETTCPAKAGLFHPGSRVIASGVMMTDAETQPYSGIGTDYGPGLMPIVVPILPDGDERTVRDPRYRVASASTVIRLAVMMASGGRVDEAVRLFDEVVAHYGDAGEPEVRAYAGRALFDKGLMFHKNGGRPQEELACYGSVIERYGADPAEVVRDQVTQARVRRAQLLEQLGDTGGALADYGAIISDGQLSPGTTLTEGVAWALLRRGRLLRTLGRREEASADLSAARGWYEKAAQAGQPSVVYNLGLLLQDSEPEVARGWYEQAAQAGHVNAMYNLGLLLQRTEPEVARGWYEKAAQAGHASAMYNLGLLLQDTDAEAARGWYEKGALAGHVGAMNNLGVLLHSSDPRAAIGWIEKAAQAGDADAMNNLGVLLHSSDPGAAIGWIEKAAQAGSRDAMSALASQQKKAEPGAAPD
jgi:TPR repeat protein